MDSRARRIRAGLLPALGGCLTMQAGVLVSLVG